MARRASKLGRLQNEPTADELAFSPHRLGLLTWVPRSCVGAGAGRTEAAQAESSAGSRVMLQILEDRLGLP